MEVFNMKSPILIRNDNEIIVSHNGKRLVVENEQKYKSLNDRKLMDLLLPRLRGGERKNG